MFAAKNLVVFFIVFSTFVLFCFLLKQFFENVKKKKKVYGRGVLERVGRVTVNATFFFFFSPHCNPVSFCGLELFVTFRQSEFTRPNQCTP